MAAAFPLGVTASLVIPLRHKPAALGASPVAAHSSVCKAEMILSASRLSSDCKEKKKKKHAHVSSKKRKKMNVREEMLIECVPAEKNTPMSVTARRRSLTRVFMHILNAICSVLKLSSIQPTIYRKKEEENAEIGILGKKISGIKLLDLNFSSS